MTERPDRAITRRSVLVGAAGAAVGLIGCTGPTPNRTPTRTPAGTPTPVTPVECAEPEGDRAALWEVALQRGLVYGSSAATWQLSDPEYRRLFAREAAMVFTEDDLLWYRLRPTPDSELDFTYGDRIVGFAERQGMLVLGAHLVWDEGFGEGWTDDDLWGLNERAARDLIFGTVDAVVTRYRGRVAAWIVANEVLDETGMRVDVPWYETIGPGYVAESFEIAHDADPEAILLLNDYGYEIDDAFDRATDRRAAALAFLDELLDAGVPVHALGVQAHLHGGDFAEAFDAESYARFLTEVADRGLKILITELDVLDDGLPPEIGPRDRAVADTIGRYLDVALNEPAVAAFTTFGLSDRYTWLQEDYPRDDGAPRRPLPYDDRLRPKPAFDALRSGLAGASLRDALWVPPRC
jgi:endo-1,4-beta-xylanase